MKKIVLTSLILLLAGCAQTNTHFNCDKVGGEGIGCTSLGTANKMADKGAFNTTQAPASETKTSALTFHQADVDWRPQVGLPLRFNETVQNMWIAPFVDTEGNYHWSQMISLVIQPGHWVGAPASELAMSENHD